MFNAGQVGARSGRAPVLGNTIPRLDNGLTGNFQPAFYDKHGDLRREYDPRTNMGQQNALLYRLRLEEVQREAR